MDSSELQEAESIFSQVTSFKFPGKATFLLNSQFFKIRCYVSKRSEFYLKLNNQDFSKKLRILQGTSVTRIIHSEKFWKPFLVKISAITKLHFTMAIEKKYLKKPYLNIFKDYHWITIWNFVVLRCELWGLNNYTYTFTTWVNKTG